MKVMVLVDGLKQQAGELHAGSTLGKSEFVGVEGTIVGTSEGGVVGATEGLSVGLMVGKTVGRLVGDVVGRKVG